MVTTTRSQIPLLGDLPLIGVAFRNTSDATQREEVIILLTPHIVDKPSDTMAAERDQDVRRKRAGSKKGRQWLNRSELSEESYTTAAKLYNSGDLEGALSEVKKALALRPTYLEAIRLKERIIRESEKTDINQIDRKIRREVERKESENWLRR